MSTKFLHDICYKCLIDLSTKEGINASGKEEVFGCIFGRDSAITIIKILKTLSSMSIRADEKLRLQEICRNALLTLITLQGREVNLESGEEPGKFIHEYRKERFDHLTNWYVYPEGVMKNYDSVDSTPLTLIALYKYWKLTNDSGFLKEVLPGVKRGLNWIMKYGDKDKDGLIEYEFLQSRKGGLKVQSWTDSTESLVQLDGSFPVYPIAPVEVQGYCWLALSLWSEYFGDDWRQIHEFSTKLKESFLDKFLFTDKYGPFFAQALDGRKHQIKTVTGNPILILWASKEGPQALVDKEKIDWIVRRSFREDMFDPRAGIRTMSTGSPTFNSGQDSYHNGSFWPKLNGLAHEGLIAWGYLNEAKRLKRASLRPFKHFQTPIELYTRGVNGEYLEYRNSLGQVSCKQQAWSAAALLDLLNS